MAHTTWGIIGAARIAEQQVIPAIRRADAGAVVAVSSASGKAAPYAERLGIPQAYSSHEALLADPDVESVYIAVPNTAHAEWILRAIDAGKHVLCEKPWVIGTTELETVQRAAQSAGVVVAEAFMYRHHPQLAKLRSMIADGVLGDLVAIDARFHFSLDRFEGASDIRLSSDMGGGSLLDIGCYPVDLFGALLGTEPDHVAGFAVRDTPGGVDTRFAGVLRYGSTLATFDCSFDADFQNTATLIGTQATVHLSDVFRADVHGGTATYLLERDGKREEHTIDGDQYAAEVGAFAGWVRSGRRDEADWELSLRTSRTLARLAST